MDSIFTVIEHNSDLCVLSSTTLRFIFQVSMVNKSIRMAIACIRNLQAKG